MTPITKYVQDATALYLSDPANGFNPTFAALAAAYGIQPFSINWTAGGPQFFKAFGTPDDLEESSAAKYPMVFLHGFRSQNTHESMGRNFSGPVTLILTFWVTHKAASFAKASGVLEATCNAIEDACNTLFYSGNWPQGYGASNAICNPPDCTRARVENEGESWRQSLTFQMVFTLDTN